MRKIKTKDAQFVACAGHGAAQARDALLHVKDSVRNETRPQQGSAENYAADTVGDTAQAVVSNAPQAYRAMQQARSALRPKTREFVQDTSVHTAKSAASNDGAYDYSGFHANTNLPALSRPLPHEAQRVIGNEYEPIAQAAAKTAMQAAKPAAKATAVTVKAIFTAAKSLIAALVAGGSIGGAHDGEIMNSGIGGSGVLSWPLPIQGSSLSGVMPDISPCDDTAGCLTPSTGLCILLCKNGITSSFGYRKDPFSGKWEFHCGLDIAAPASTPILAAADGTVVVANATDSWGYSWGYYVKIQHANSIHVRASVCPKCSCKYQLQQ